MTIRNLEYMFKPQSIALIGASKKQGSIGSILAHNLFNAGFDGPIMPVNPKYNAIEGVLTYPDVASLPVTPDLAIISTPPNTVPEIIETLGKRGTRAAIVITAGFGESKNEHGHDLEQAMLDAARPYLLRILGPNCLGLMVPGVHLNASFCHLNPKTGSLAFVAQSGAVVTSVADWADKRNIGFSHLVSLGGMSDIDFGDMLDYLANDPDTRAILLYIESVKDARKFLSAGRSAARMKPVVVVKAGRHTEGARAASSHTGALAGNDAVYDAVFDRAGMLRVSSLLEIFDAVEILAAGRLPKGDRLAILSNGGGIGVMATDALIDDGGHLAELSDQTLESLDAALPVTWSHGNPVDIIGDAPGSRYAKGVSALMEDSGIDAILVLNCPTAVTTGREAAQAVIEAIDGRRSPMLLTSWVGDAAAAEARELFAQELIPSYYTPGQAVRAFMYMVNYQRNQQMLMETPASIPSKFKADTAAAQSIITRALEQQRQWLTEPEAKAVLETYNIPVVTTKIASSPQEAAELAAEFGSPVVLKILSEEITHKSDVGGVVLDLNGPANVKSAAQAMLERISKQFPEAVIEGFTVSPMVERPGAYELIVGMFNDLQFGPVLLFGAGGTAVEVMNDKALGLPPLNMHLAKDLMSRTRIYKLLKGYRDQQAINLDAVALTLIKLSQLISDLPEIVELDINPLLADEYGVVSLDARIRIQGFENEFSRRLAISPYPRELEEMVKTKSDSNMLLRPIRPEDEPALQQAFKHVAPEQVRLRFFVPMKTLSHVMAARFTQIDYDREMALILTEQGIPGEAPIYGVVHISADPDNIEAEFDILLRNDMAGQGLGHLLMEKIINYACSRGIAEIFGHVLRENSPMLGLCKRLGFVESIVPGEPGIVRVSLPLLTKNTI